MALQRERNSRCGPPNGLTDSAGIFNMGFLSVRIVHPVAGVGAHFFKVKIQQALFECNALLWSMIP
jgi:hypothetical protein